MNADAGKYNLLQKLYLFIHRRTFEKRLAKQVQFRDKYILSVGNLSAGGTGKTPLTMYIAKKIIRKKPMVVLRGYGGAAKSSLLVCDGKKVLSNYKLAGDEAMLYAQVKGLRVAVAKKRKDAIEQFAVDSGIVFLDDAFQNPSVFRNHDLVLIDATIPPSDVKVFPTGLFREDLSALHRADTVLLTRTDQISASELKEWKKVLSGYKKNTEVFESAHKVSRIRPALKSRTVGAFCGIGNSESFFRSVEIMGYQIHQKKAWPDHHSYSLKDLDSLIAWNLPLVTTAKDAVRIQDLEEMLEKKLNLHILDIEVAIKNERQFLQRIFRSASGKPTV